MRYQADPQMAILDALNSITSGFSKACHQEACASLSHQQGMMASWIGHQGREHEQVEASLDYLRAEMSGCATLI